MSTGSVEEDGGGQLPSESCAAPAGRTERDVFSDTHNGLG